MRSHCRLAVLLLFAFLIIPQSAFGWGAEGHRIVADIAEARLSAKTKSAVAALLGDKSLEEVATWADEMRQEHPAWSPWHFVDIPFSANSYDSNRDGKKGDNLIDKLTYYANVLANHNESKVKRVEALKFVVHFVGDVHQPMHCVNRDDHGGNSRLVFFLDESKAINLHTVWDTTLLKHMKSGSDRVYAGSLDSRISAAQAKEWSGGNPQLWAEESHAVAVKDAYNGVPADGAPPKLGEDYVKRNEDVVKEQLIKAGVRLAGCLIERWINLPQKHRAIESLQSPDHKSDKTEGSLDRRGRRIAG